MNQVILFSTIALVAILSAMPTNNIDHISYLHKFGYLKDQKSNGMSESDISKAISDFQNMAGIEQTGSMNKETKNQMKLSRCGNVDQSSFNVLQKRIRRYRLFGTQWKHMDITYKVTKYSKKLTINEVDESAVKAFKFWSDVTPLTFRRVYGNENADINMEFVKGKHDDNFPFDGPGTILAHAFQPESGRIHFDEDEPWTTINRRYTINIVQVMTHEIGHAIGLKHSKNTHSVMKPYYRYSSNFKLYIDDIRGIRSMYGSGFHNKPSATTTTATTTTTTLPPTTTTTTTTTITPQPSTTKTKFYYYDDICNDPKFDAITQMNGDIFAFKGSKFYILNGKNPKEAKNMGSYFRGVPSNIDAVLSEGDTFKFIKNGWVYFVKYNTPFGGYHKQLKDVFPGVPISVSSAFTYKGSNYFISNGYYYRSNSNGVNVAIRTFSPFLNTPRHVDAMFHWPGYATLSFSGNNYHIAYKDSNNFTRVKSTSLYWLNCM